MRARVRIFSAAATRENAKHASALLLARCSARFAAAFTRRARKREREKTMSERRFSSTRVARATLLPSFAARVAKQPSCARGVDKKHRVHDANGADARLRATRARARARAHCARLARRYLRSPYHRTRAPPAFLRAQRAATRRRASQFATRAVCIYTRALHRVSRAKQTKWRSYCARQLALIAFAATSQNFAASFEQQAKLLATRRQPSSQTFGGNRRLDKFAIALALVARFLRCRGDRQLANPPIAGAADRVSGGFSFLCYALSFFFACRNRARIPRAFLAERNMKAAVDQPAAASAAAAAAAVMMNAHFARCASRAARRSPRECRLCSRSRGVV